jgi:hypothetical protein
MCLHNWAFHTGKKGDYPPVPHQRSMPMPRPPLMQQVICPYPHRRPPAILKQAAAQRKPAAAARCAIAVYTPLV